MNIRKTSALVTLGLCSLVGVVAYRVGRARADGVPTASPLYYGGVLDDGGRPVEGMRNVTIRLWDMATGGTAACTTVAPNTPFSGGRFRIELDAACTGAVRANPNLWAEVLVDSTTFARTKLGAVPYALEAGRAAGASGPLEARIAAIETSAQPRQVAIGPMGGSGTSGSSESAIFSGTPFTFTSRTTSMYSIETQCVVAGHVDLTITVVSSPAPMSFNSPMSSTDVFRSVSSGSLGLTTTIPVAARGVLQAGVPYTVQVTGNLRGYSYSSTYSPSTTQCSSLIITQLN
jgi:hypothetical protein